MEDTCAICGKIIPEGRQVCPVCESKHGEQSKNQEQMDISQEGN